MRTPSALKLAFVTAIFVPKSRAFRTQARALLTAREKLALLQKHELFS
jgi:hypothetical protein